MHLNVIRLITKYSVSDDMILDRGEVDPFETVSSGFWMYKLMI